MRTASFLGLAAAIALAAGQLAPGQEVPKGAAPKPMEVFAQFRTLQEQGRYDLAAGVLQTFLDSNPTDRDLLDLEARYGTTVFQNLRNVPKWSDDPKTEKQARANVEEVIKRARLATDKLLKDPGRINKYIRNLGQTYEERVFAELELKKTGDFAVPYMVEALKANSDANVTAGIYGAIPKLDAPSMAAWLASLDGLKSGEQYAVLAAITSRPDALNLLTASQTDYVPVLWRLAAQPAETGPAIRKFATDVLNRIYSGTVDRRRPEAELVAIAQVFHDRKARYVGARTNGDGSPSTVPVWTWDAAGQRLVKTDEVPVTQADEYFGLRYARWALEIRPDYEPAQSLIISLAAERAEERANFGDLAKADPAVYKMLADAPSNVLNDLLDRALGQKRTALILALTQALGDRADKAAASPRAGNPPRPSLLARGLDYPDPRVQLAAAVALLRSPVPVEPAVRGKVMDILRRAAATDPGVPGGAKGQALVADPNRMRADFTASQLRALGFDVEIFATGRDLLRRVGRASDFDLIVVDHHIVVPELPDLVAQLRSDPRTTRRPVLVVASTDHPVPPSIDTLILRLALLIAATDAPGVVMPAPYVPDPRKTPEENEAARRSTRAQRDGVFRALAGGRQVPDTDPGKKNSRSARLLRLLDTSGLELSPPQRELLELRVEQITYAVLAAEFPMTAESSPDTFQYVGELRRLIGLRPNVPAYVRRAGVDHLMELISRLELDVSKVPAVTQRYEEFRARVSAEDLGLVVDLPRDTALENRLARLLRNFPAVKIVPEPYSRIGFETDIRSAYADPADMPRDPAEKRAGAKIAVDWLSKMATGELTGFDARAAEGELRAALRVDALAESAIDAVARFPTAEAQQDLISVALTAGRPLPLRMKAADAAIRHIQTFGKLTPKSLTDAVAGMTGTESNNEMRGKLVVLKGLLAPDPNALVGDLLKYNPPLVPAAPAKEPGKEPGKEPAKEPEKEPAKEPAKEPQPDPKPKG